MAQTLQFCLCQPYKFLPMTLQDEQTRHMAHIDSDLLESTSDASKTAAHTWDTVPDKSKRIWKRWDSISFGLLTGVLSFRFWLFPVFTIMWMYYYWEPQDDRQALFRSACIAFTAFTTLVGVMHIIARKIKTRIFIAHIVPYKKNEH